MERSKRFARADIAEAMDNVLRLGLAGKEQSGPVAPGANRNVRVRREWAAALDAIHQAAEQLRATDDHARDVEARGVTLVERALKELKIAEGRIEAAEAATRAAEARCREAELRAKEAEEWVSRLHDEILSNLISARADSAAA